MAQEINLISEENGRYRHCEVPTLSEDQRLLREANLKVVSENQGWAQRLFNKLTGLSVDAIPHFTFEISIPSQLTSIFNRDHNLLISEWPRPSPNQGDPNLPISTSELLNKSLHWLSNLEGLGRPFHSGCSTSPDIAGEFNKSHMIVISLHSEDLVPVHQETKNALLGGAAGFIVEDGMDHVLFSSHKVKEILRAIRFQSYIVGVDAVIFLKSRGNELSYISDMSDDLSHILGATLPVRSLLDIFNTLDPYLPLEEKRKIENSWRNSAGLMTFKQALSTHAHQIFSTEIALKKVSQWEVMCTGKSLEGFFSAANSLGLGGLVWDPFLPRNQEGHYAFSTSISTILDRLSEFSPLCDGVLLNDSQELNFNILSSLKTNLGPRFPELIFAYQFPPLTPSSDIDSIIHQAREIIKMGIKCFFFGLGSNIPPELAWSSPARAHFSMHFESFVARLNHEILDKIDPPDTIYMRNKIRNDFNDFLF